MWVFSPGFLLVNLYISMHSDVMKWVWYLLAGRSLSEFDDDEEIRPNRKFLIDFRKSHVWPCTCQTQSPSSAGKKDRPARCCQQLCMQRHVTDVLGMSRRWCHMSVYITSYTHDGGVHKRYTRTCHVPGILITTYCSMHSCMRTVPASATSLDSRPTTVCYLILAAHSTKMSLCNRVYGHAEKQLHN